MESKNNQTGSQEIKPGRGGKRQGAGRPKRAGATPTQAQADQVEAARRAYDSKLAVRTETPPPPTPTQAAQVEEPSAVTETRSMVSDCGTIPRPHDAQGGCCWRRVAGVELVEKKGTVRVTWYPILIDGSRGPQVYSTLDEWAASGGGIPVENPVLRSGHVVYRLRLSDGTVSDQIIRQPVKAYAKLMNLPLPLPAHLTPLERPPLCPPSLVMPERSRADDVRENIRLFDWKFPTAKDADDLIEQYETLLATRTEREMAEAKRHADMLERQAEQARLRKVGDFNRLMDSGA